MANEMNTSDALNAPSSRVLTSEGQREAQAYITAELRDATRPTVEMDRVQFTDPRQQITMKIARPAALRNPPIAAQPVPHRNGRLFTASAAALIALGAAWIALAPGRHAVPAQPSAATAGPSGTMRSPSAATAEPSGTMRSPSAATAEPSGTMWSPSAATAEPSGTMRSPSAATAEPSDTPAPAARPPATRPVTAKPAAPPPAEAPHAKGRLFDVEN